MDTKKDIGQFFNDRLNQMEFTPNENGWNKIEEELDQKKRKKRAFFWMFFGAFLSGCLLTLLMIYSTNLLEKNTTIDKNQNNSGTVENSNNTTDMEDSNNILNEENSKNDKKTEAAKDNNKNSVVSADKKLLENKKSKTKSINNQFEENKFSNTSKQNKINRTNFNSKNYKKDNIILSSNNKFSKTKRKNNSDSHQILIAQKSKKSKQKNTNSTNSTFNSSSLKNTNSTNLEKNLLSENEIQKEIKNDTTKIVISELEVKDTTSLALVAKKSVKKSEKLLEKDSTEVITKKQANAFILSPYFGYGLLNKNQVTGNFKATNNVNISNEHYGFMFRWIANKKLGIQIGLGYLNASTKTEIEKTDSDNIRFNDVENSPSNTFPPSNKLIMSHDLSMYEIPLELYYKLNDNKIGFAIASGISHTIIKDNDVYLESSRIGSLQTITNQSFSANLKVYGSYKISEKLQFELYPSFQYQFLNSLKNKDLNPYILSIRAGISYQF